MTRAEYYSLRSAYRLALVEDAARTAASNRASDEFYSHGFRTLGGARYALIYDAALAITLPLSDRDRLALRSRPLDPAEAKRRLPLGPRATAIVRRGPMDLPRRVILRRTLAQIAAARAAGVMA